MNLYHSIFDFRSNKKTVVTLGTFDGVHIGHQKIIARLVNTAKAQELESVIITFSNHPRSILDTNEAPVKLLTTTLEKIELFEKLGIDHVVLLEFNAAFAQLTGQQFVKNILLDQLNMQKIIIGYDHKFGKNRSSDIHDLEQFGKKYNFEVEQILAKEINEIAISSTKIRDAITNGNIKKANQYLGYPYFFTGKVVLGKQLGRTINFPTANICIENSFKIIPKQGVYAVIGIWGKTQRKGMMNIGYRPTVNGTDLSIEVHFFNCNQDLYNQEITVCIHDFVRNEKKFESIPLLQQQLIIDAQNIQNLLPNI